MECRKIYAVIISWVNGLTTIDSFWWNGDNARNRVDQLQKSSNGEIEDVSYTCEKILDDENSIQEYMRSKMTKEGI